MVEVVGFLKGSQVPKQLRDSMDFANKIRIAVAFLKEGGYVEIESSLVKALKNNKNVEFIVGACPNYRITDPSVLEKLQALENIHQNLTLRFFGENHFHPKLFIFERDDEIRVILGSSNLTAGGISSNIEANIIIEGKRREKLVDDILRFFDNEILGESSRLTRQVVDEYKTYCASVEKALGGVKTVSWKRPESKIDWKNYPYPMRVLTPDEREAIRKKIGAIAFSDWQTRYCVNLAEEYKTSTHQIRGLKAWVHHPDAWKTRASKRNTHARAIDRSISDNQRT